VAATGGRSRWRSAAKVLVAAAIVAAVCLGAWFGARQVYFLGTDEGGRLTLYRGLPYDLPLGIELYSEVESAVVQVSSIPEDLRESAIDHDLRSRDDAVDLLNFLEEEARAAQVTAPPDPATGDGGGAAGDGAQAGGGEPQGGQQGGGGDQGGATQPDGGGRNGDRDRAGN
jgi:hypothetical protein